MLVLLSVLNNVLIGAVSYNSAQFGRGSGHITLSFLQCSGYEERLIDCRSSPTRVCSHVEDAGVRCRIKIGKFIR